MDRKFRCLYVLWLIVAISGVSSETGEEPDSGGSTTVTTAATEPTTVTTAATEPTTVTTAATEPTTVTTAATEPTTVTTAATEPTTTVTTTTGTGTTTTAAPNTGSTTSAPSTASAETTTPSDNTVSATTPSGQTDITTGSDDSATTQVPSTTDSTTTQPSVNPCVPNPCGRGSTCVPRVGKNFECLCLPGTAYNNDTRTCENAKVFPGQLNTNIQYDEKMRDKTSEEFEQASNEINDLMSSVFIDSGYSRTIVLEIQPTETRKVGSRAGPQVSASVDIVFSATSEITTEQLKSEIQKDGGLSFTAGDLCVGACDTKTTTCTTKDGTFTCTCNDGFVKTDFSDSVCLACPSGQKAQGSACVNCPFGYSGLNCNESWQLALVITGSVLGGLLLITLILLPVVAVTCSKKSSKSNTYEEPGKSYLSHSPAKSPLVNSNSQAQSVNGSAFANPGVPKIPRATTTSNGDSRTNLEMTPSNSRQNLISADRNSRLYEDQDDINPYAQSRSSGYAQTRPQNNPYAQSRPQVNPYAQTQGQGNSYYNGRRFN